VTVALLGVRHHGPGSARAVVSALDELRPDAVLVEGPADADPLLGLVGHEGLRPPVALLAHAADDPSRAAFWPFASFSPEWQALTWAARAGVPARFCDLPAAHSLATDSRTDGAAPSAIRTDPLALLAGAAGYDDPERWWDDVVEQRLSGAPPFAAVAEAMTELRGAVPRPPGDDGAQEERREAWMRQVLRRTLKAGAERVAVVCGAWHVPALATLGPAAPDARLLTGLPRRRAVVTWVPWTHSRLAAASGYGAGVDSPGWYSHLFGASDRPVARWLTGVARELRTEDLPVSSSHVIEAVRLAETLATLRHRPLAGLAEVQEATLSVLCEGDPVRLELVTRRLVVGEALGSVPAEAPTVPVAADLHARARRLRLKQDPSARELDLDLRGGTDLERSRLLHRLLALEVPWGRPSVDLRRSTGTFRETWTLRWYPGLEVSLVEASTWGTTVEAAATARVLDRARSASSLAEVSGAVETCLLADLGGAVAGVVSALAERSALAADSTALMDALPALARSVRYGDVRGTDVDALRTVVDSVLTRTCVGLPAVVTSLDDDGAAELRTRLDGVTSALGLLDRADLRDRWLDTLDAESRRPDLHGLVAGRMDRTLYDAGRLDVDETHRRLGLVLTVGTPPAHGADYVEGFFAGGGLLLVHDDSLLELVDSWIGGVPADTFTEVLPLLRRTFGAFARPERRSVADRVGRLGSAAPSVRESSSPDLDEERARAVLPVVHTLLGVRS
jgi:hypothetical protein